VPLLKEEPSPTESIITDLGLGCKWKNSIRAIDLIENGEKNEKVVFGFCRIGIVDGAAFFFGK